MKIYSRLLSLFILLILSSAFISCTKNTQTPLTVDQLLTDIEVDLTKLKKEAVMPGADETALDSARTAGKLTAAMLDSLLLKYPDSFLLYSLKVYQQAREGREAMFKLAESEQQKDTTNLLRRYFRAVLDPDTLKAIKILEQMIADQPDNYLGYFGLAQRLMEKEPYDLAKPAKLTYLALLKEHRRDEPYYLLTDIFSRLNRVEDNAILNGILLINKPANEKAFFNVLNYFGRKGEKEKAVALMETFRKNNPSKLSDLDMAYYLTELKFYEQAGKFLANVPAEGEDKVYVTFLAAKIAAGSAKKDEALKKCTALAALISGEGSHLLTDPVISDALGSEKAYLALVKKVEGGAPTIGDKAVALKGKILNGADFIPQSLNGKVYLIDFWATWCAPCREEMPNVRAVYNDLHAEGFEVIGVNLDTEREVVQSYSKSNGLPWLHIYSGTAWKDINVQNYRVQGIPATVLVDKKGVIRYKGIRGRELLLEKVKQLLTEGGAI